jgi:hypothetical protein
MIAPASVRAQPAFDDPDAVLDVVRGGGPYWPLARYALNESERAAVGGESGGGGFVPPWFRQDFATEGILHVEGAEIILGNQHFVDAARGVYGETVRVEPTTVYVNIMGPTSFPFVAHVDVPAFRGITRADHPVWLLHQMKVSGLFEPWRIRLATAVSWFYEGAGGAFHYWPDGPDGPGLKEESPFQNVAIVADNEITYHGVSSLGLPEATMPTDLTAAAELHRTDGGWIVRDRGADAIAYTDDIVRVTISWKAEIYSDASEVALVVDHLDDLTLDRVVDAFAADPAARGQQVTPPSDPLNDPEWIAALAATYREPSPQIV